MTPKFRFPRPVALALSFIFLLTAADSADAGVLLHQVRRVRAALDHGVTDDPAEPSCV